MTLLLGLDTGTTKLAAVALDVTSGEIIATCTRPNLARRDAIMQGLARAELDVAQLQAEALALLRELAALLPAGASITALGVTGQQHGLAFLDADGAPLAPAITWQDQRALEPHPMGATYLSTMVTQAGGAARFHNMGCQPAPGYLGATVCYLAEQNTLPRNAHIALIPDAVVAALIGQATATDPTQAGSSALFDVAHECWDHELIADLGLNALRLPEVRPTGARAGALTPAAAAATNLAPGLPVAVALGDNQASFIGSVSAPAESILVNIGTGGQVSALVERFCRLPALDTRAFPEQRYLLVGAGSSGGATLGYLHALVCSIGRDVFGVNRTSVYDELLALAAQAPPGAAGAHCAPHFAGTRLDPSATAAWSGLTGANLTLGNLTRALLEGVATDAHDFWQRMAPVAGARRTLVGAGNGLTRNPVLHQALATRFGLPLSLSPREEAAAGGAALAAGVAAGVYETVLTAMQLNVVATTRQSTEEIL